MTTLSEESEAAEEAVRGRAITTQNRGSRREREAIQQPAKVSIGLIAVGSLVTGFVAALADATHESLLLVPTDAAAATKAIRDVVTSVRTSSPLN